MSLEKEKLNEIYPTDDLTCASYCLTHVINKTKNFIRNLDTRKYKQRYISEHATDKDYQELNDMPRSQYLNTNQRFKILQKIVKKREQRGKQ